MATVGVPPLVASSAETNGHTNAISGTLRLLIFLNCSLDFCYVFLSAYFSGPIASKHSCLCEMTNIFLLHRHHPHIYSFHCSRGDPFFKQKCMYFIKFQVMAQAFLLLHYYSICSTIGCVLKNRPMGSFVEYIIIDKSFKIKNTISV